MEKFHIFSFFFRELEYHIKVAIQSQPLLMKFYLSLNAYPIKRLTSNHRNDTVKRMFEWNNKTHHIKKRR